MAMAATNAASIGPKSLLPGPPAAKLTQSAHKAAKPTTLQNPFCVLIFMPTIIAHLIKGSNG